MSRGFVHSIKVPRLYKTAAKILRDVCENGGSLKSLIYEQKHPNVSAIYSLCFNALQKEAPLNHIIQKSHLLLNEPRMDVWLAKILITELLWGKQVLNTDCKPAQTIRTYESQLRKELNVINDIEVLQTPNKKVRKARYVRVNTLILSLEKEISYFEEEGWSLLPKCLNYTEHLNVVKSLQKPYFIQDFHIPELFVFPADTSFYDHPRYLNGELILQDKASCLPAQLLNPNPGSVVIDMCAAPGMKSSHLAALMNNSGKIYAVEIDEKRYSTLCEQIKLTHASSVQTVNKDALTLDIDEYSNVEYILVDPTCSGSGMLDRQAIHGNQKCDPQRLKQLQAFQVFLLRHALLNFPNVKKVVYSTCSINPEENEQVIDEILDNIQDAYKLVNMKKLYKKNWCHYSSNEYKCSSKCLYANSEVDLCNGFFVAVFKRNFNVPLPPYKRKGTAVLDNEQLVENDRSDTNEPSVKRKRKKRGKKKKINSVETFLEETTLNVPLDSINKVSPQKHMEEVEHEPAMKKKKASIHKVKK